VEWIVGIVLLVFLVEQSRHNLAQRKLLTEIRDRLPRN